LAPFLDLNIWSVWPSCRDNGALGLRLSWEDCPANTVVTQLRSNWVTTVLAGFQTLRMLIKARSGLINKGFTSFCETNIKKKP
jgi:hypothetical protein